MVIFLPLDQPTQVCSRGSEAAAGMIESAQRAVRSLETLEHGELILLQDFKVG